MTSPYHLRRAEKAITDPEELLAVIRGQKFLTLALCQDHEPYLVTMNYAYDQEQRCFYFHCARRGKKVDYLRANPTVWGQVLEDRGYLPGQCDHAYRTVQFRGQAEWIENLEEKRHALMLMIDQLEPDPEPVKRAELTQRKLEGVGILKVRVETMSGKQGPVAK